MSFFKASSENISLKETQRIHPVENLKSRVCKKHDGALEFSWEMDQLYVSFVKITDHTTHKMGTLEEEAQNRKTQLGIEKATDHMILVHQQEIHESQRSVEASKTNAEETLSYSLYVMCAVLE